MNIARAPLVLIPFLLLTTPPAVSAQTDRGPYDIVITGGRIVDGTGNPWLNGTLVIDGGEHTGARPGRALRGRGFRPAGPVSDGTGAY